MFPRRMTLVAWSCTTLLTLLLLLLTVGTPLAAGKGSASGQLLLADGTPAGDGVVLFFNKNAGPPPAPGRYWRLPDVGGRIGPDGRFFQEMPAGDYYFGVISVPDGSRQGPPASKDWLYLGHDSEGKLALYTITDDGQLDLGTITASGVSAPQAAESVVILEGIITDADGTPVAEAVVELYAADSNGDFPLFQSEQTSADGRYRLEVAPGRYVAKAFRVPESKNLTATRQDNETSQEINLPAGSTSKTVNVALPPAR